MQLFKSKYNHIASCYTIITTSDLNAHLKLGGIE